MTEHCRQQIHLGKTEKKKTDKQTTLKSYFSVFWINLILVYESLKTQNKRKKKTATLNYYAKLMQSHKFI